MKKEDLLYTEEDINTLIALEQEIADLQLQVDKTLTSVYCYEMALEWDNRLMGEL